MGSLGLGRGAVWHDADVSSSRVTFSVRWGDPPPMRPRWPKELRFPPPTSRRGGRSRTVLSGSLPPLRGRGRVGREPDAITSLSALVATTPPHVGGSPRPPLVRAPCCS